MGQVATNRVKANGSFVGATSLLVSGFEEQRRSHAKWRAFLFLILSLPFMGGCFGLSAYYRASDAPDHVKNGVTDARLAITRTFGGPLSPIVRNVAAPYGSLRVAKGLEAHLRSIMRPLDIVLVRSRPALTRFAFPTHFTHVVVWLGDNQELARIPLPSAIASSSNSAFEEGKTVFESAKDSVRLSDITAITNTSEIAIVRMGGAAAKRVEKTAQLLGYLGQPFDYNFDLSDRTRMTCLEVAAEVFTEIKLPVRYTTGRYVLIPDDLARLAALRRQRLRVVSYIIPGPGAGFVNARTDKLMTALSEPSDRDES